MGKLKDLFSGIFGRKSGETKLPQQDDEQAKQDSVAVEQKKEGLVFPDRSELIYGIGGQAQDLWFKREGEKFACPTHRSVQPEIETEKQPMSEDEKFYLEMKQICKASSKFRIDVSNAIYFNWASLYYEGDETSVLVPKTVKVDGKEYEVRYLYSKYNQEITLENILIEAENLVLSSAYLKNARNICFAPGVKKCEISASYENKNIIPINLQRINLSSATQSVREYLLSKNAALIPYFRKLAEDDNGLKRLDGCVIGADRTIAVYDSGKDEVINLAWVSSEFGCEKIIIRSKAEKIIFPDEKPGSAVDFESIGNKKFCVENDILYRQGKKRELLYFNRSYQSEVLQIASDVNHISGEIPSCVHELIVDGVCKFNKKAIDLANVRKIVLKDRGMVLSEGWMNNLKKGAIIYANAESVAELTGKPRYLLKPLADYVDARERETSADIDKEESVQLQNTERAESVPAMDPSMGDEAESTDRDGKEAMLAKKAGAEEIKKEIGRKIDRATNAAEAEKITRQYPVEIQEKLKRLFEKILQIYPEKKIFAFDSIAPHIREDLSACAKKAGKHYSEIISDYGFVMISADETAKLRNTVIYTPVNEPAIMKGKIDSMLTSLEQYYPNRIIEKSIQTEHKKLASNISGLYQWFGYSDAKKFLAAYGYDYRAGNSDNGTILEDPDDLIAELQSRTSGKHLTSLNELLEVVPDLKEKIDAAKTRSRKFYNTPFVEYLQKKGILYSVAQAEENLLDQFIADMHKKYPQGSPFSTAYHLFAENSNTHYDRTALSSACRKKYGTGLQEYLIKEKILSDKKAAEAEKFADYELNSTKTRIVKYHGVHTVIEIPAEIKIIEKEAFQNTGVEEISFESGSLLSTVGEYAFEGCENLKTIDFGNVTGSVKIKSGAFKNCKEFREIFHWQKVSKIYEGAFEGAKNVFLQDGDYIYPRLWLFNMLKNGSDGCTAFDFNEEYGQDCTPRIILQSPYMNNSLWWYVKTHKIPVASRCGYDNVVISEFCCMGEEDEDPENCRRDFITEFDLPTWESVGVFLKNFKIELDEKVDLFKGSEDDYINCQREVFDGIKNYSEMRKADRKAKGLPEELIYDFTKQITAKKKKIADVVFFGGREYHYNSSFDVKAGDLVFVTGVMDGILGFVTKAEDGWDDADYMKEVVSAYSFMESDAFFPYAQEEERLLDIFPGLEIKKSEDVFAYDSDKREYEETDEQDDQDEPDYDTYDGLGGPDDQAYWDEYKEMPVDIKESDIELDDTTDVYACVFKSKRSCYDKKKFKISFEEGDGICDTYKIEYKGEELTYLTLRTGWAGEKCYEIDNFRDLEVLASYCSHRANPDFEIQLIFRVPFDYANGRKIKFPSFGSARKNGKKVRVKFPDGKSYACNCEYAVRVGDKVKVEGKRSEDIGEVISIVGEWDNSSFMKNVQKVLPTEVRVIEITGELPIISDDGYPFGYENSDEMIRYINAARRGDIAAAEQLIEIYMDATQKYYNQRKAEYWKKRIEGEK